MEESCTSSFCPFHTLLFCSLNSANIHTTHTLVSLLRRLFPVVPLNLLSSIVMAPRAYTGSRSGNRRTAARARTRSSAARQTRPLTPSLTSGNTPVLSPSILSRPQGVTVNNNEDVQARVDSAFEASMQARNRDNDLAAAVSGLLLLGATSSAATTTCRK